MSRSDWLRNAAAIGCLIVGLGYCSAPQAQTVSDAPRNTDSAAETAGEPQAGSDPIRWADLQSVVERIASAIEAVGAKEESPHKEEREESDLRAQWAMAKWAKWMFIAAGASVVLTLIGVFLIWRTLIHTRDAARAARDTVVEAKNATKAAEAAVKVTQDTAERELRAYVLVDKAALRHGGPSPRVEVQIRNFGQTPAYDLTYWIGVVLKPFPLGEDTLPARPDDLHLSHDIMGPGGTVELSTNGGRALSPQETDAIRNGTLAIYAFGEIRYTDAFKQPRSTDYRMMCRGAENFSGGKMSACDQGNRAD